MKVIGFNFKRISIEKKKEVESKVNVNTNIHIKDIEKQEIDIFHGKEVINFEYEMKLKYELDFAEMIFEGNILVYFEDFEQSKKILKEWKAKNIPEEVKLSLVNLIFLKCSLKALQFEEDFNLPYHITMPVFSKDPNEVKGQEK